MNIIPRQYEGSTVSSPQKTDVFSEAGLQTQKSQLSFWRHLREILAAMVVPGVVSVVGMLFPFSWLQPHLIFCVLFLFAFVIALRYQRVTTYIVSFLVAGCYSLLLWYQEYPSFVLLQICFEPFLLFICSVVANEVLYALRQKIEITGRQYVQQKNLFQEMKRRYQATQALNVEWERQIAGQAVSVTTVSEKMAHLWRLQGRERDNAILDLVMHALRANFCALYIQSNGGISLCASRTRESYKCTTTLVGSDLDVNDALISRTIQSRQVCTIHDVLVDSRSTQRAVALMAGPLVDHRNQVVGIVVVDDIPLLKFLPTTVRLFGSLLQVISMAIHTAMSVTDGVLDTSLPFKSSTDMQAVQPAMLALNGDTAADDGAMQIPGLLLLPGRQKLRGERRLRLFVQR